MRSDGKIDGTSKDFKQATDVASQCRDFLHQEHKSGVWKELLDIGSQILILQDSSQRDWRISCSCTGVYGARWIVCTLDDGRKAFDDDEDVRVCVLAMPMSYRTADAALVRVKIDVREWVPGVMWSSSSRMKILKEVMIRTGTNRNSRTKVPFRVQPYEWGSMHLEGQAQRWSVTSSSFK